MMARNQPNPVAEVRVRLHSLKDGEAEVEVAIDPKGELSGAYGSPDQRFEALQTLFETVQRELADAFDTLVAEADADVEEDSLGDAPENDGNGDTSMSTREPTH